MSASEPKTAVQVNTPLTGGYSFTPTVASLVNTAQGAKNPAVAKLRAKVANTNNIKSPWARIFLHGMIDSWKTTTAACFGTPENTRIIFTRTEDQLLPLRTLGYTYLPVASWDEFAAAAMYPEQVWPDWATLPDRTLVIDDITRVKEWAVEENETNEAGRMKRDQRMIVRDAKSSLKDVMDIVFRKTMHVLVTCLSVSYDSKNAPEETVTADLPQSIRNMLFADTAMVFFMDKKILTRQRVEPYSTKDERGQDVLRRRVFFARYKVDVTAEQGGQKVLGEWEPADLRAVWNKITGGGGK